MLIHLRESLSEIFTEMLVEAYQREVRELRNTRPYLFVWCAHAPKDGINSGNIAIFLPLAFTMIAVEQRPALYHLGEYASDRPNVHS
jgi:hypothetical protein